MKHLKKFNELNSSTYISAASKLSEIDHDEFEINIDKLHTHSDMMKIINNENGKISEESIDLVKRIMRFKRMQDKLFTDAKKIHDEYIESNIRKVSKSERSDVRDLAWEKSHAIRKPVFDLKREIINDINNIYDLKLGDVFNFKDKGDLNFFLYDILEHEYRFRGSYDYESVDSLDFPLMMELGEMKKLDLETVYDKNERLWKIKEDEVVEVENVLFNKIKDWFEDYQNGGNFDLTDEDEKSLSFSTRQNGNVGSETPGKKDIEDSHKIVQNLNKLFGDSIRTEIYTVDEWTYITIHIK